MKKLHISFLAFLVFCTTAKATECSEIFYKEEKINLWFCQNQSSLDKTFALLYKARTKVLNDYIKQKIADGKLQDKKFEIQILDRNITYPRLELTQGKNGYFVQVTGYPSLQQLLAIVDYFSKPDWKPFLVYDYEKFGFDGVQKKVDKFLAEHAKSDTFLYEPFVVWRKDDISLKFTGDSLRSFINDIPLSFRAPSAFPAKIQDRYLFFQHDSIFVVQDMQVINSIAVDEKNRGVFRVEAFPKWVNISPIWEDWIYSYSYDRNKFYRAKQ